MLRELTEELTKLLEENEYLREELRFADNGLNAWRRDYDELQERFAEVEKELTAWRQSYEALKIGDLERQIARLEVVNAELQADLQYWRDEAWQARS